MMLQLKKFCNARLLLLCHQWYFVRFLYLCHFFSLFSLSPWKKQHDHRTLKDWWTLISASIITCVSDVKTSLSASTYPSSVKWTSGDSHLSLKSLSYVSRNLKWTLSSDWLYTCFSESIPNFLKQFLVKQISMLQ